MAQLRCSATILALLLLFFSITKLVSAVETIQASNAAAAVAVNQINSGEPERAGSSSLLEDLLFTPIRATIQRLFGRNLVGVQDGLDSAKRVAFETFMHAYNKTYLPEELPRRMKLFTERKTLIDESRKMFEEGRSLFAMKENSFIDWSEEELKTLKGVKKPNIMEEFEREEESRMGMTVSHSNPMINDENENENDSSFNVVEEDDDEEDGFNMTVKGFTLPQSADWRQSGCISEPLDQKKCAACYVIATVDAIVTKRCIIKKSAPVLSAQQVIDCAKPETGYRINGCSGGWPTQVLKYLQDTRFAARQSCYSYTGVQSTCRMPQISRLQTRCLVSTSPTDTILRYKMLHNELDILYHLYFVGPVVSILQVTDKFFYYSQGVFEDPDCSSNENDVDHAVLIVGYGTENGADYWLVKNSWGSYDWGMQGFAKIRRGTYACSIGRWAWSIIS